MVSYTLKIRGGREVDSKGKKAGKGPLSQKELAMTLAAAQDQYLIIADCHPKVVNLNKDDIQSKAILDPSGIAPSLYSGECRWGGGELYILDDQGGAIMRVETENTSPTIRAETHGHVPLVVEMARTEEHDNVGNGK